MKSREILKGDAFFKSEKRLTLVIWTWFLRSQLYRYQKMQKIIIQNVYPSIKFDSFCLFYGTFGICAHWEKFGKILDGNLEYKLIF